ncbi:patatin-like phospholipase family protein [Actinocrinis puniceicyclus]|uniref:Patatin-like phospholipase family protein n=1 Tax=Actinocrinis puniceicyclus TaxID=977794 RepID=A0A8J7WP75_9ACTN|nr:patatin-like phospholipase family protein [Actinocrinis puniceicyclus]MBS2963034.1 patatin-like phospholipase family protein [Actinocrinis puniceicyclus]
MPASSRSAPAPDCQTTFVLGGGGHLGAYEVGMLRALLEAGIKPDLVLGTSVGAINGAVLAADPSAASVARLEQLWTGLSGGGVFEANLFTRLGTAARTRTHLYSNAVLRRMLESDLPVALIEELAVPFQCVAASIERAAEHWFTAGPIADAVLASCAVPGLLPPVEVGGEHFLDGGLVDSVPVGRAVALGARTIYVLHVGRLEQPLRPPRRAWEVAAVAFEIARRHRFARDITNLPQGVTVHLLPTGADTSRGANWSQYVRYRAFDETHARIERAYAATDAYLRQVQK